MLCSSQLNRQTTPYHTLHQTEMYTKDIVFLSLFGCCLSIFSIHCLSIHIQAHSLSVHIRTYTVCLSIFMSVCSYLDAHCPSVHIQMDTVCLSIFRHTMSVCPYSDAHCLSIFRRTLCLFTVVRVSTTSTHSWPSLLD